MTENRGEISPDRAVEIARQAIQGHVILTTPENVSVERRGRSYLITFPIQLPTDAVVVGADYDARVTIDAYTGAVIEILGGP